MEAALRFYQSWIGPFVRYGITVLVTVGLWAGLRRAGLTPKARLAGIVTTVLLMAWLLTTDQLGRSGFYASHWEAMQPLCWAIAIFWLIPITRSESIVAALDATPPWWIFGPAVLSGSRRLRLSHDVGAGSLANGLRPARRTSRQPGRHFLRSD
jgi:hypothetical protein